MRVRAGREHVAILAFRIVLGVTLVNVFYNLGALALGYQFPYTLFLFRPDDNFGDFFSLLQSYPGGHVTRPMPGMLLYDFIPGKPASLQPVDPGTPMVTHFHMMPISTLVAQLLIATAAFMDPTLIFLILSGAVIGCWCFLAYCFGETTMERVVWATLGLIAYPMLLMLQRGNVFAGASAMLVLVALLLGLQRRAPIVAAILLAIAVNIRPNVIVIALPLLALYRPHFTSFSIALAVAGMSIVTLSMIASTALYPAYHLETFLGGLKNFHELYILRNWGLAFGSSLGGGLTLLFGRNSLTDPLAGATAIALILLALLAHRFRRLSDAQMLFVTVGASCLGTASLADYHLLVLLIVPMAFALEARPANLQMARTRLIALVAACVLLAPKNYIYLGSINAPISLQVAINPLLLTLAIVAVLASALQRQATAPSAFSPAIRAAS